MWSGDMDRQAQYNRQHLTNSPGLHASPIRGEDDVDVVVILATIALQPPHRPPC